jgi:transcriptional regulator with XRE-family HTH domain
LGLTQAELAKKLGTTQQTIGRWESGQSTPSLKQLDVIAYYLNTTVDGLLGRGGVSRGIRRDIPTDEEGSDAFWGHLGLLLPTEKKSRWYPISERERSRIWSTLRNAGEGTKLFVLCETLNNRMLAFSPRKITRIWLLDDACDGPSGDWNSRFPMDDYEGHPPSVYEMMDEWLDHSWGIAPRDDDAAARHEVVSRIIKSAGLEDPDELFAFLHHTFVMFYDGRKASFWVEPDDLWIAISDLEFGDNIFAYLPGAGGTHDSFFPVGDIALIEMPLLDAIQGQQNELRELEKTTSASS